jgi:nickel-dependent lactate racemase
MKISLKHGLWNGDYGLSLQVPDRWNTTVLPMQGDNKGILGEDILRRAITPLAPMLKDKKEICILFDDLSRPTKAYKILPLLLELFEAHDIRDEQVRFICALGTHGPLDNTAFRKKLGAEMVERFPIFNHNPFENCDFVGKTRLGTPLMVNKEYLSCDLRIGIGAFVPHSFCGFGGGCKIIMPALSHIDTIEYHHGVLLKKYWEASYGIEKHKDNPLLDDIKECGRMARLNAKIDVLINTGADIVDIFAGNPDDLYAYMADKAPAHYSTKVPHKADIVVANAYSKADESVIALSLAEMLLKDTGGHIVLLCDVPEGQIIHYLLGRFGKSTWGRLAFGERKKDRRVRKIFICSQYRDRTNEWWFGGKEDISWHKDLNEIINILDDEYKHKSPDVLVLPDATIQTLCRGE